MPEKQTVYVKVTNTFSGPIDYLDVVQKNEDGIIYVEFGKTKFKKFLKNNGFTVRSTPIYQSPDLKQEININFLVKDENVYGQVWNDYKEKFMWDMISPLFKSN